MINKLLRAAPRLQSRLPLPPPAMLNVKRSCLVRSTALAELCVSSLVCLTSKHPKTALPETAVRKLSCRTEIPVSFPALYALAPCITLCVMGLASDHHNDVLRQLQVRVDVAARRSRITPRPPFRRRLTALPSCCPPAPPTTPPSGTPPSPPAAPPTPPSPCPWPPAAIASAAGRCPCARCRSRSFQSRPSTPSAGDAHCSTCISHPRLPVSHPTASKPVAAAQHGRGSVYTPDHTALFARQHRRVFPPHLKATGAPAGSDEAHPPLQML